MKTCNAFVAIDFELDVFWLCKRLDAAIVADRSSSIPYKFVMLCEARSLTDYVVDQIVHGLLESSWRSKFFGYLLACSSSGATKSLDHTSFNRHKFSSIRIG